MMNNLPKNAFFIGPIPDGADKIFRNEGLSLPENEWASFVPRYSDVYDNPGNPEMIARLAHDFPHRVMLPYNAKETEQGGTIWFLHPLASRKILGGNSVLPCCDVRFEADGSNIDVLSVDYSQIVVSYRGMLLPIYVKERTEPVEQKAEKRRLFALFSRKPRKNADILMFPITPEGSTATFIGEDNKRPGEYLYRIQSQEGGIDYRVRPLPQDVTLALFKDARACTDRPQEAKRIARELERPSFLPVPNGMR